MVVQAGWTFFCGKKLNLLVSFFKEKKKRNEKKKATQLRWPPRQNVPEVTLFSVAVVWGTGGVLDKMFL